MRGRWLLFPALAVVAALLFALRHREDAAPRTERAETRPPESTTEPVEAQVKTTVVHGTLSDRVEGAHVFVQPLPLVDGELTRPPWTTKLIDRFTTADGDTFTFELPEDVDVGEVLVLAPGFLPATAEYHEDVDLEVELERGDPVEIEVVDEEGRPLPGAEMLVYASSSLPPHQRLVSGEDGKARVLLNEAGYLQVTAPGRTRGKASAGSRRVALQPAFVLAGQVVDSAGAGIAGVRLVLKEGWADVVRSSFYPRTVSGPDGRFAFEHISYGDCEISAVKEGYVPGGFYGWAGQDDVEIRLYRPASISGRVVGAGLAGERVRCLLDPILWLACDGGEIREDGTFTLTNVPPDSFTLTVETADWIGELPVEVTEGDVLRGLTITVRPKAQPLIRVRVLGPDGAPRPGVTLWTTKTEEVKTDARGEAVFPYPAEDYEDEATVYLTADGPPAHDAPVYLLPPDDDRIEEIRLPDWATATIFLDPPGLPVALDHKVWGSARWVVKEETDPAAGRFVFRVNPEMVYRLLVDDERRGEWTFSGGRETRIPAYDGEASVRLRFADETRQPLLDTVYVEARDGRNWLRRGKRKDDGSYLLVPLWSGVLRVTAGRHGSVPEAEFMLELAPNEDKEPEPIVLKGYRWLTGVVRDETGHALGGAAFRREGALTGWNDCGASHPDGTFRVRVAKNADGFLRVSKYGYGDVALSAKRNDVTVVLPPAGELELTVPARLSKLQFERELPLAGGGGRFFPREDSSDLGRIRIEDVAVGELRLRLPGGVRIFEIRAGETTRAVIR